MERIKVLTNHLSISDKKQVVPESTSSTREPSRFPNSPDDIVVVSALRTPIGKSRRGVFKVTL